MAWWLIFAVFLYLLAAILLVAEVFIPSGGLISIFALACVIGGVAIFFNHSIIVGWIGVAAAAIMIPAVVLFAYRLFPKTGFGRAVTLSPPHREQGDAVPDTEELKALIGSTGTVLTPLRPVGMCDFSGEKIECVAESGYVDKDKKVKVIDVQSTQVTVRTIDEES